MSAVEIESKRDDSNEVTLVKFKGSLDLNNFSRIKTFFEELANSEKNLRCVVDIEDVMFIASSIWAVFIARSRMAKLAGGKLVLCNMPSEIKSVYDAMNISTILPCAQDYDTGVELMQSAN